MRRLILASRSKARQKLLRQLGLKFQVADAKVREVGLPKTGCRDLVVANALKKARAVAKKFSGGIVIGADTVVSAGGKIIGKPRDKPGARAMLRLLTTRPCWFYTGLAVVDLKRQKTFTACEKTKVYLRRLNRQQIRDYLQQAAVLERAGAFDIQGRGGRLLERIEGGLDNVAGLPLKKLTAILAKLDFKK